MIVALLFLQKLTSEGLVRGSNERLFAASTMTVTVRNFVDEFPKNVREERVWTKGSSYRREMGEFVEIGTPEAVWQYEATKQTYRRFPGTATGQSPRFFPLFDTSYMPAIGAPAAVVWHGRKALRVELDGRKAMSKETKLFLFFDPDTKLISGISANLGSITQVTILDNLKLNGPVDDSLFRFTPPAGWKKVDN